MHFSFGVLLMNMTNDEYRQYSDSHQPRSKCLGNCLKAFLVGGLICCIGEAILNVYADCGLDRTDASSAASATLVFIGALLTGLGLYDRIARSAVGRKRRAERLSRPRGACQGRPPRQSPRRNIRRLGEINNSNMTTAHLKYFQKKSSQAIVPEAISHFQSLSGYMPRDFMSAIAHFTESRSSR